MSPEVVTVKAAADELGVHPDTIKRWIKDGVIDGFKLPGGHWRVTRAGVDALKQPQEA